MNKKEVKNNKLIHILEALTIWNKHLDLCVLMAKLVMEVMIRERDSLKDGKLMKKEHWNLRILILKFNWNNSKEKETNFDYSKYSLISYFTKIDNI